MVRNMNSNLQSNNMVCKKVTKLQCKLMVRSYGVQMYSVVELHREENDEVE